MSDSTDEPQGEGEGEGEGGFQPAGDEPELTEEERKILEKKQARAKAKADARRKEGKVAFSITSLMDALTIILCFLLQSVGADPMNVSQNDDLRVPKSSSILNPESDAVPLTVSRKGILVGTKHVVDVKDGTVDKSRKKGGETSFLITPLFDGLVEEANNQKQISKLVGTEFAGIAAIVADHNTPYRLLLEVLYTAGQAEFGKFKFAIVMKKAN